MLTALTFAIALLAPLELQKALDHFDFGQYAEACALLAPLKDKPGLTRTERITVLSRLGACHHFQGAHGPARVAFQALLDADPQHALDPVQNPPELLAFFRDIKTQYAARKPAAEVPSGKPGTPAGAVKGAPARKSMLVAISPFGAGQFQNEQPGKGAVFASLQTVSLGLGVIGLALFEAEKDSGSFLGGGTFKDTAKANNYQSLYTAGFLGFAGLWIYGAVDAVYHLDANTQVTIFPTPDGFAIGGSF